MGRIAPEERSPLPGGVMIRRASLLLLVLPLLVVTACKKEQAAPPDAGAEAAGPRALKEKEPNNSKTEALPLTGSSKVAASLSVDPSKQDEDWYALTSATPRVVDLTVSGIPGA